MKTPNGIITTAAPQAPHLPHDSLILVPMRNIVLFPNVILPVGISREPSIAGAQYAVRHEQSIGIILQKDPRVDEPGLEDLHTIGTQATVLRYIASPDGGHHMICQGESRFRIVELLEGFPFLVARIEPLQEIPDDSADLEARVLQLRTRIAELFELLPQAPEDMLSNLQEVNSPTILAALVTTFIDLKPSDKQEILETISLTARFDKILHHLDHVIEVLKLSQKINEQTRQSMDQRQREYLLREQMKAIQKELGEGDELAEELDELKQAINNAAMPEDIEKQARKELKRLERMSDASGEYSIVRTYLEWLTELPWQVKDEASIDITVARRILDEDHYGLEKIKRRILEFLAVRKLNPDGKGPILCFVGPPGVGKTSLGQSIARAIDRPFVRVSLGGMHDEAEIRGHRRTYIGALPGNIIQAIRKAGARNCLMMLDEIDKLGVGFHGDPSAALLEVLDPEQNHTFRDNYLAVPFNLSKVLFITTANMLDTIPMPLRDRMEVIELPGYTEEEKLEIARRYLLGRQLAACGVQPEQCSLSDSGLQAIIRDYTREAGLRNLEREIGRVLRYCAMRLAEGHSEAMTIESTDLATILGPSQFENESAMRTSIPGVATGLAWTPVGGDILFIEATRIPGSGNLILTGQLGDIMQESAQAAWSLVRARIDISGFPADILAKTDVHIHIPAGATPKDGPSAGITLFITLMSLFTNTPVRGDIAMTGEISLRGLVLPVGGIKEKVLAALRAGITTVLMPARNRKDLEEIPPAAREKINFVWMDRVEDALEVALAQESSPYFA